MKKLFLLDNMALVYRAYFAFANNHRLNSKGINTSAVFGYTNTLIEILEKEKPSHIAVVTDTAAPTERHITYTEYKANREEMPDDIATSLPIIEELVKSFNIPFIAKDGYEADDIIGTLATQAEKAGFDEIFMMTPDKDFGQLVTEKIKMYKPARMGNSAEKWGIAEVCNRYQIQRTSQVIDILGLMGDSVDNIPGIPGVGEKTAIQLIKDFDSIENLLENTHLLKGKLKEKVENNKDKAILSKQLATIITNAPVSFNEDEFKVKKVNEEAIKNLFQELEFRTLIKKIIPETIVPSSNGKPNLFTTEESIKETKAEEADLFNSAPVYKTLSDITYQYHIVQNETQLNELITKINSVSSFAIDTETTSLNIIDAELVGISISFKKNEAYYIPVEPYEAKAKEIVEKLKTILCNDTQLKIGQNIKYDYQIFKKYGAEMSLPFFDTMIAHYLLQPDMRHNMDVLSETYLNYSPVSIETLIGKKDAAQGNMRDVPLEKISLYAAEDADVTYQLYEIFEPMIAQNNLQQLMNEVEMPLIKVLAKMEMQGVNLDVDTLKNLSNDLSVEIKEIEKRIYEQAGVDTFNIASPKQLGEILFDKLKIDEKAKKTKTGQYATGEEVLVKLESKHPIITSILDYRELVKLQNTYVDALPLLVNKSTQHVHTTYNQAVAATGRLSSINPNLQNIPIRTPRGQEIRKAFIPSKGNIILSADYSQIELRIIAALSDEQNMIQAFKDGIDIHTATASKVWNVSIEEVTKEMRSKAKTVNFGIIYGISAFGLSERINIPRTEAKEIINNYFEKYPNIKKYMNDSIEHAKEKGYVSTILGRRRYLKDINASNAVVRGFAERNAINAPIQGSSADIIKLAMIKINEELKQKNFSSKLILQVHDELVFDCVPNEKDELSVLIKECMSKAVSIKVPLEVEVGVGENWLQAH